MMRTRRLLQWTLTVTACGVVIAPAWAVPDPVCVTFESTGELAVADARPLRVVAADLNSNGIEDLLVGYDTAGTSYFTVYLGLGNGVYAAGVDYAVSTGSVHDLVVGDFNEDGRPDVAATNHRNGSSISILYGMPDGTLGNRLEVPVSSYPTRFCMRDFNHDGHMDLAVSDYVNGLVTVLHGQGDGTFAASQVLAVPNAYGIAAADFDGDGELDLVTGPNASGGPVGLTAYLVTGNTDGSFGAVSAIATGVGYDAATGDFNNDGHADVALAAELNGHRVSVLYGHGDGTFDRQDYAAGTADSVGLVADDLNGDGVTDLVSAQWLSNEVCTFLGETGVGLQTPICLPASPNPLTLTTCDFNADGHRDLAIPLWTGSAVKLMANVPCADCQSNGIPDECDLNCAAPGCNTYPGCVPLADCNSNRVPDACECDFDGDGTIDDCDEDIDNDGVPNEDDVCDFTPAGAIVEPNGGVLGDLDGDCDVDLADYVIFTSRLTGPSAPCAP